MASSISVAEVLEALRAAWPADAEGFSSAELAAELGIGHSRAGEVLRGLVRTGKVVYAGHRIGHSISGQPCRVPVYKLTSQP